jgi:hypothetical protein
MTKARTQARLQAKLAAKQAAKDGTTPPSVSGSAAAVGGGGLAPMPTRLDSAPQPASSRATEKGTHFNPLSFQGHQQTDPRNPFRGRKISVLVGTPCYGGLLYNDYFNSVVTLIQVLPQYGIDIEVLTFGNESLITRGRNSIVSYFLASRHTHLLFIDADVSFGPMTVLRALRFDRDVVCAAYPKKSVDWDRIKGAVATHIQQTNGDLGSLDNDWLLAKGLHYNTNYKPSEVRVTPDGRGVSVVPVDGYIKVLEAATGFMLIKRNVFDVMKLKFPHMKYVNDVAGYDFNPEMADQFYSFFDCVIDPVSRRYLSEDWTFCHRWQECGGDIWLDAMSPVTHTGTFAYRGDVRTSFMQTQPEDVVERHRKHLEREERNRRPGRPSGVPSAAGPAAPIQRTVVQQDSDLPEIVDIE